MTSGYKVAILTLASTVFWLGCGESRSHPSGTVGVDQSGVEQEPAAAAVLPSAPLQVGASTTDSEAPVASMSTELAREFRSLAELASSTDRIVVVRVESRADAPFRNLAFSQATVTVERVVKGNLKVGEQIVVVETGGLVAITPKDSSARSVVVETGVEGVPVMKPGQRLLLFLQGPVPSPVGAFPTGSFGLVGAFQGKVRIGSGEVLIPPAVALTDAGAAFTVARALAGRELASVIAEIGQ